MLSNDGEIVGMCGVRPSADPMIGYVWMLCTEDLVGNRITSLRAAKAWLAEAHRSYPILTNVVDEPTTMHVQLPKRLGCVFTRRYIKLWVEHQKALKQAVARGEIAESNNP